ncbi:MAG: hypothetical protein ACI3VN_06570 [Candidatus Onthomonas sp.]
MFGFGKKKKKAAPEQKPTVVTEPAPDRDELLAQAAALEEALTGLQGSERIDTLNKLGGLYFKAQEYSKAIERYETSLNEDPKLGIAHKDLMKLYSAMKKQAAAENDTDKVMLYVNKMEALTSVSKNSMRSGNF